MFSYKRSALLLKVLVATTVTLVLGLVAVLIFYSTWMRNTGPDFPDKMEGEAVILSEASGMEVYHVKVDFNKKIVQFSLSENTTSGIVAPKIVVHDYNAGRSHFILSQNGISTPWCIYTDLSGEMIPKNLLRHATLQSKNNNGNSGHDHFLLDNDSQADVYRANDTVYKVDLNLTNATVH
ncbi:uncharacterized protein LOC141884522 [Acropora palmata]